MHRDSTPRAARLEAVASLSGCQKRTTPSICEMIAAMIPGLDGTVAVVTGGASGIGAACCRLLEASGATVHVADREGEPTGRRQRPHRARRACGAARPPERPHQRRRHPHREQAGGRPAGRRLPPQLRGERDRNPERLPGVRPATQGGRRIGRQRRITGGTRLAAFPGRVHGEQGSSRGPDALTGDRLGGARHSCQRRCARLHCDPDDRSVLRERDLHAGRDQAGSRSADFSRQTRSRVRSSSWRARWRARSRAWSCPSTAAGRPENLPYPGDLVAVGLPIPWATSAASALMRWPCPSHTHAVA